jgi:hypothetical protein
MVGGPGWPGSVSGHTGFHGVNPYVNVGVGQILRHVNFIWAMQAEVRKGRFGVLGGFLYLNGQAGVSGTGLVSRVGAGEQEFIGQTFLAPTFATRALATFYQLSLHGPQLTVGLKF